MRNVSASFCCLILNQPSRGSAAGGGIGRSRCAARRRAEKMSGLQRRAICVLAAHTGGLQAPSSTLARCGWATRARMQVALPRQSAGPAWARALATSGKEAPGAGPAKAIDKKDEDTAANAEDETLYKDQNATWADKHLPESVLPYAKLARVDRPIGTYLLLLPGLWSIGLAAEPGHLPNLELMALFGIGAFVMRGAGCTINDFWDRDIDGKVKRTRQRPLASGRVSPLQAWAFLAAQCSIGLAVLVQMNTFTIALGAASLVPVALYPLAKRYIGWPQAVLGLTFNWGALLGWAAVHGDLDLSVTVPLYLGGALWTLMYDTIYAHQDKEDDRALGLRSSALTIGDEMAKPVLAGFGAGALALWALAGANAGLGASPLYLGALGCTGAHFAWQIGTADLDDRLNLTQRFVSNQTVGAIMLAGIVGGKYML